MSYLVLARKYRPQTFADVTGQETIVETLQNALKTGRIAHAFLFTGSRGVGKTTIARLLAKALACETGITATPCGVCNICKEISAGTSMDVLEIDGASNTGVDDVRDLREASRYQPSSCRFRIFIIDEVHMLSTSAFNALLKTLEEPPPHVKFIFATTEAHKIPATILSRCQRYDFRRLPTAVIIEQLKKVLGLENISVESEGLAIIAKNAEGGMRDALSLTDQVISFSGKQAVTTKDVTQILGLMDRQSILRAAHAIIHGDAKGALQVIEDVFSGGYDPKQLLDGVTQEIRHLTIALATGSTTGIAELSDEELKAIGDLAKTLDLDDLQRLLAIALEGIDQMARSEQPRLMLELTFLRMAKRPAMAEAATVMEAIARLEAVASNSPIGKGGKGDFTTQPPRLNPPTPFSNGGNIPNISIDQKWRGFVETCTTQLGLVGHHLEHGSLAEISQDKTRPTLQVTFQQKVHYQAVLDSLKDTQLQNIVLTHYGKGTELKLVLSDGTIPAVVAPQMTVNEVREFETQKAQEDLEIKAQNNPIVQKALQLFGGEIKAVKAKKELAESQESMLD